MNSLVWILAGALILISVRLSQAVGQWRRLMFLMLLLHWLLQICVVLLGFGMNLPMVLRLGLNGSVFAAATIGATLLLGYWPGRKLALDSKTSTLISVGCLSASRRCLPSSF